MRSPEQGGDWGVLGGSFDPIHRGHLNLVKCLCQKKRLKGVLFVPAYKHPLKKQDFIAAYPDRVAMLKLALKGLVELQLCEIDKEQNLPGYTIVTLRALKKRFPAARFHFIIGADLVEQLKSWHQAEELLDEASFLVGSRPGTSNMNAEYRKNLEYVEITELDISATDIRNKLKAGATIKQISKLVPAHIAEYIFEKGLYW